MRDIFDADSLVIWMKGRSIVMICSNLDSYFLLLPLANHRRPCTRAIEILF